MVIQSHSLIGYAVLFCSSNEAELTNIAVRKEKRGSGIGSMLLSKILDVAADLEIESVFLKVRRPITEPSHYTNDLSSAIWGT